MESSSFERLAQHNSQTARLGWILLFSFWLTATPIAWGQVLPPRASVVTLPQDSTGGTDDFYYLDLGSGGVTHGDQLRRDPLQIRAERMGQNLFGDIGRPTNQAAADGEILLAPIHSSSRNARAALFIEASTGYVAFFDQLGRGGDFGKITTVIGRPFAALAATDGNFALLPLHNSNGRTTGAYLYHATSGRALLLNIPNKLKPDVSASNAAGFPQLSGHVSAAELTTFERTTGYLIADGADGSLRFLDLEDNVLSERSTAVNLYPVLPAENGDPTSRRLTAVPLSNSSETTTHVLFADAASGELAVLEGVEDPARQPILQKLATNLYSALATNAEAGWRTIASVPGTASSGQTHGVWLIDSLTRRVAYVENPQTPGSASVRRVRIGN